MKIKTVLAVLFILIFGVSLSAQNTPQPDFYGVPYLQEALNNAEARYQAGGLGVTEEEIVTFHNHLVETVGLPEYAKLSQPELRMTRMLLSKAPVFGGLTARPEENQKEVTHIVSPMAAAYLEDFIIFNKRFNAGYQIAPNEWSEQKVREHQQLARIDQVEGTDNGVNHTKEIHKAMRAKGSLSYEEAAKLLYYLTETFKLSTMDATKIMTAALEGK
jgi:hypothetical protein